jgi:hypothetical protein
VLYYYYKLFVLPYQLYISAHHILTSPIVFKLFSKGVPRTIKPGLRLAKPLLRGELVLTSRDLEGPYVFVITSSIL